MDGNMIANMDRGAVTLLTWRHEKSPQFDCIKRFRPCPSFNLDKLVTHPLNVSNPHRIKIIAELSRTNSAPTYLLLVRTGNSCLISCCCIIWCIGGLCIGMLGKCWRWLGGVASGSLNDEFCALMTRSLSESRRELLAVDVLGLSLSVDWMWEKLEHHVT